MYGDKKIAAVIAAAGAGSRMNGGTPKQYMKIGGKAMLAVSAEAFGKCGLVDCIVVVTNADYIEECGRLLSGCGIDAIIAAGGKERQDSVFAGLNRLPEDTDYVLIHDAARPFVTRELIERVICAAVEKHAAVCAVPVKDTIRIKTGKEISVTADRNRMYAVQTPQGFEKDLIVRAYERAYREGFYGTDDASLAERAGHTVYIVDGSYDNIKITTKSDMPAHCDMKAGIGFDAHAFESGRKLMLGGVAIPFERGLSGHSDADVLVHAVIDALLGAAGQRDIGYHFPDSDDRFKDISSLLLLEKTVGIVGANGYETGNIDVTVIAEKPKIAPYISEMEKKIAGALGISEDNVNIKGTTTEKLGFTGREEGIAAQAVCMIYSNKS